MNAKQRAVELFNQHIELARTDGRAFRKTVMDQLMAETGCSLAAAATHYNTAKKANPIDGLGRAPAPAGLRKPSANKGTNIDTIPDNDCFTVMELIGDNGDIVGRSQSFIIQGDASETFDSKKEAWPNTNWVMIRGLGPNPGETFQLADGEVEIKRYNKPVADVVVQPVAEPIAEAVQ